ncbi:hypothetical protein Q8G47_29700, partial [Klebsiella pneumoniae]|uniref:hypothetical protein n=1 Tax=Klebsiella pneumoniae TaxID=573 RepID=UPI0030136015
HIHPGMQSRFELDQRTEKSKRSKVADIPLACSEQDKPFQTYQPLVKDGQGKVQGGSTTRSCTKVHKQGIALGRSVD